MVFPGSHLGNVTLKRCLLDDVVIRRTDLVETRFVACEAREVQFYEPRVSRKSTRLELTGLGVEDVAGIRVVENASEANYQPSFITDTLRACGTPIAEDAGPNGPAVPDAEMELMERLIRRTTRTALVCLQDNTLASLFADPGWPGLQRQLVAHGIVKLEERATSGRRKQFLRPQFLPKQILAGSGGASRHGSADPVVLGRSGDRRGVTRRCGRAGQGTVSAATLREALSRARPRMQSAV